MKPFMPYRLSLIIATARKLKELSMKNCQLEDEGLMVTFDAISTLREIKKVDFSTNRITNRGLEAISEKLGGYYGKSALKSMTFNNNSISTPGIVKLFEQIEQKKNELAELYFYSNNLTDDAAQFVSMWLKQMRMSEVEHSMNLVVCDMGKNLIMHRYLKDLEQDLNVNRRYKLDAKNRKIQAELT